jgi:hypothetical protein
MAMKVQFKYLKKKDVVAHTSGNPYTRYFYAKARIGGAPAKISNARSARAGLRLAGSMKLPTVKKDTTLEDAAKRMNKEAGGRFRVGISASRGK